MSSLDLQWLEGDVGDWFLRIGRVKKIVHIYQNPWSPLWIIDAAAFGMDKEPYATLSEAKLVAELTLRDWIDNVLYRPPSYDDDLLIFAGGNGGTIIFDDGTGC